MEENEKIIIPDPEIMEEMEFKNPVNMDRQSADFDFNKWLSDLIGAFRFSDILQNIKKGSQYVVQIPEKYKKSFEAGELIMTQNSKTGKLWPSLYKLLPNGKHEFVCNLPVKLEEFTQGSPLQDFSANIQTIMLQRQIAALKEDISEIKEIVQRIEQGQTDDRIGLLISGRDQLYLALDNPDPVSQERELERARGTIQDARGQIFRTLISRAETYEPIPRRGLKHYLNRIDNKYAIRKEREYYFIQDYFGLYVEATKMLAGSFEIVGDHNRAQTVITNAMASMKEVDFSKISSIKNLHPEYKYFFEESEQIIECEGQACLDSVAFDCLRFELTGADILEAAYVE